MQPPSSPQLDKRQHSSKVGKKTSSVIGQKLGAKTATEGRSASKSDIKKGKILVICDGVLTSLPVLLQIIR